MISSSDFVVKTIIAISPVLLSLSRPQAKPIIPVFNHCNTSDDSARHGLDWRPAGFHIAQYRLQWTDLMISFLQQSEYGKRHPDTFERLLLEGLWFLIRI